jgi:hypothetical protein
MTQPNPRHPANELAQITQELGVLILRGYLQYPGPETGDWEINGQNLPDLLYQLRERPGVLILAAVDGKPVRVCGFVREEDRTVSAPRHRHRDPPIKNYPQKTILTTGPIAP